MELKTYLSRASNIYALNKLLLVAVIVSALATIYSVSTLKSESANKSEVIVPLSAAGPMQISMNEASYEYLIFMARDIIHLSFNYTALNARKQFEQLLYLYAPEVREQKRRQLLNTADKIEKVKRITRAFYIDNIETSPGRITVTGLTARRLGSRLEEEQVTIEIKYRIEHARFMIERLRRIDVEAGKKREPRVMEINDKANLSDGDTPIIEGVEDEIR